MQLKELIKPNTWLSDEYKKAGVNSIGVGYGNGYVGVPKEHELYRVDYNDIQGIDIHGGLTFSDFWQEESKDNYWYLGFDTCHAFDNAENCNKQFVESEVKKLKRDNRHLQNRHR